MAGQVWATNSLGGYMYSGRLSKILRMQVDKMCKFRQFADAKDATANGKNKGATYNWNVYSRAATQGTVLVESTTIPETNFTITQGTLTMTEYGNSVPFTEKLDNLSEQSVKEIINKVMKYDATETLDLAAAAQFNATPLYVVGTASASVVYTTNGTATATNNSALLKAHVKIIVDTYLKERNIPAFTGDDYCCMARPSTFSSLAGELESVFQYTPQGFQNIIKGEIGRYYGCRFIEQTNYAAETTNFNANSKSDAAFFFGNDTVCEAIAVPEEIRGKIPTDYGRSKGVAWYYLGGFGLVHAGTTNARIIKWASAD